MHPADPDSVPLPSKKAVIVVPFTIVPGEPFSLTETRYQVRPVILPCGSPFISSENCVHPHIQISRTIKRVVMPDTGNFIR